MKLKKLTDLKFSFMAIVAFMAIMLITGCGDKTTVGAKYEGKPGTQKTDYYDIVGTVLNDAGDPIQHVFINIIDYVMSAGGEDPFVATVRTDGNGEFGLRIPGDNAVRQVTLKFAFQDVVTYVKDVAVSVNKEVDLGTITLTQMSLKTITDSTIANTLNDNVRANANVTIGADALVESDGTPFTTATVVADDEDPITATVAIGYVDTTSNPEFFPGNFYSTAGGSLKLFSTYGILEIKVTTDDGNTRLNLAAGQTVAISIPVGDLVNVNSPDFPATVDLWYYNEDVAEWVLEQEDGLTFNAATRSFTGVVSHFSAFNAGYTFETKYLKATVVDDRGNKCPSGEYDENNACVGGEVPYLIPLPGSTLKIFTETFSPYGVWNATYTAGDDGSIPDRMDPSITGLLYSDEDGYFVPVPGSGNLMKVLEYTNPRNNEDGSRGPDLVAFEEGAVKYSEDYLLPLSTAAYITGEVFYENGEPATGAVFMFNDPTKSGRYTGGIVDEEGVLREAAFSWLTFSWVAVADAEAVVPVVANVDTYVMVPSGSAVTAIKEAHWNNLNGPSIDEPFVCGEGKFVDLDCNTFGTWDDMGAFVLESPALNETLNIAVVLADPPSDVKYTHINGSVHIPDDVDPTTLWVVIKGTYNDRPVTVRAAVDADGNWPADNGTFNPVTVDGVEGLFVKVPAETDLTITVGDYVTNPLSPVIYYTYDYTSGKEFTKDSNGNITGYVTNSVIPAPNAYIEGQVTYNTKLGADLRIVFTKENPGEDDTPVTVTTDEFGSFSANLEFDTDYIIEIWDDTVELYPDRIYAAYYTSNPDGEIGHITYPAGVAEGLIQIGDEYIPIATVSGTVYGEFGPDMLVTFTPTTGDPISAITDEDGEYTANLLPSTDYEVTVSTQTDGVADELIYPTTTYPHECVAEGEEGYYAECTDDVLPFTSSDEDSNFTGNVEELDILIGESVGDEVYHIPAGSAGVKGVVLNSDGTPVSQSQNLYVSFNGSLAQVVEDGEFKQWYMDPNTWQVSLLADYMPLTPDTEYTIEILDYTSYPPTTVVTGITYTSPAEGVLDTLKLELPAEGTTMADTAYVKGVVLNSDGTPVSQSQNLYVSFNGSLAQIVDDGIFMEWYMDPNTWAVTLLGDYMPLTPDTEYTIEILDYTSYPPTTVVTGITYTSPAQGVMETLKLKLPAEGTTIADTAYVRGKVFYSDGTPVSQSQNLYVSFNGSLAQIVDDGIFMEWYMDPNTWAVTLLGDYMPLTPDTEYTIEILDYTSYPPTTVVTGITYTSPAQGVVESISLEIP